MHYFPGRAPVRCALRRGSLHGGVISPSLWLVMSNELVIAGEFTAVLQIANDRNLCWFWLTLDFSFVFIHLKPDENEKVER